MRNENVEGIPVLMYHDILKDEENTDKNNPYIISLECFLNQVEILYKNSFHTITLSDMENYIKGKIDLPKRSILITFDDGYKCCFKYAYPVLRKYSYKAAAFLVTSRITNDDSSSGPKANQFLNWREINEIRGTFEFACHTHNLHTFDSNNKSLLVVKPREIIVNDIMTSKDILGTRYFAYPFGQYSGETKKILKETGFTMAFTVVEGYAKPGDDLFEIKRIGICPDNSSDQEFINIIGANNL